MTETPIERPPGEYAIVELLGHTTLIGRVAEVERFGTKLMAIEPIFADELLPVTYQGGGSIYRFTPCSAEVAFAKQATREWHLPPAVRAVMPPAMLAAPETTTLAGGESDPDRDDDPVGF